MFDIFNVSLLSSKELIAKIDDLNKKLSSASMCNMNSSLIDQIKTTLNICYTEYTDREYKSAKIANDVVAWDMESYLSKNKEKADEQENIPRWKSAALSELSNASSEPWNTSSLDDFD